MIKIPQQIMVDISTLKPYAKNTKKHGQTQNAGIAAVLKNRSFSDCMLSSDCRRCAEKVFGRTK